MREAIVRKLEGVLRDRGVRLLYACESGSRAWGFESPDSHYDVRFVYAHAPDWYLSIEDRRDVIESVDGELDFSGWELRKALRLFRKSNPPMLEWMRSPIVYAQHDAFVEALRGLEPLYFSPRRCFGHYLSMARGNVREYLHGETVWRKKYFYVLRPLLACRWLEQRREPPPMEFQRLVGATVDDEELRAAIDRLVEEKRRGGEAAHGPQDDAISAFIEVEMARLAALVPYREPEPPFEPLNRLFARTIGLEDCLERV